MNKPLPAVGEIKEFFPKHRICVVKVFLLLLNCVIQSGTVNLNKCRVKAGIVTGEPDLKLSSVYTRLIRFFNMGNRDAFCFGITLLILSITQLSGTCYLVIDRTNWEIGGQSVNVLCLGLLLPNGIFIPIICENLNKKGNSCARERKDLLERFQKAWPEGRKCRLVLLGDREFVGLNFFVWLTKNDLSFVIRSRWGDYFGQLAAALDLTTDKLQSKIKQSVGEKGFFQSAFEYEEQKFWFTVFPNSAKRKPKNERKVGDDYVVLVSDQSRADKIGDDYRKRWGIEVFFRHAKTNGLNLEDANFKEREKIQLLVGVIALAYCLSIREGLIREQKKPPETKKHGAKAVSTFRNGYDNLAKRIYRFKNLVKLIIKLIVKVQIAEPPNLKSV